MSGTLTQVPLPASRPAVAAGTAPAGPYLVRPAGPADDEAIRDFLCGLSVQTQYFRFFTAMSPPSRGLLRALTAANQSADILLVTSQDGQIIGHGMVVDAAGERAGSADVGLVVADEWQGQGLGTLLLRLLTQRAADRGMAALVLDVLPENSRMLGIVERRWPDAVRTRTLDSINFTAPVASTPAVPVCTWIARRSAA
jgi:ribosomal protein S18 acetylase RimI-like enzyme